MADLTSELKNQLIATAGRQVELMMAQRATSFPPGTLSGGEQLGALGEVSAFDTFATGYDSGTGETVLPFTFDLSLLDGPDRLAG